MEIRETTKRVKEVLSGIYGHKNVSVKRGRGTACGWVEAQILIDRPAECEHANEDITFCSCKACIKAMNTESSSARKAVYADKDIHFYTYTCDDGYNTESDCFLLEARFKMVEIKNQ